MAAAPPSPSAFSFEYTACTAYKCHVKQFYGRGLGRSFIHWRTELGLINVLRRRSKGWIHDLLGSLFDSLSACFVFVLALWIGYMLIQWLKFLLSVLFERNQNREFNPSLFSAFLQMFFAFSYAGCFIVSKNVSVRGHGEMFTTGTIATVLQTFWSCVLEKNNYSRVYEFKLQPSPKMLGHFDFF